MDALTAQAAAARAKVLLVGDHAQLSAMDAGGAFNLLAERGRPAVLTSLWRFTHQWEAAATRGLRTGDRRVLDAYADHDRISAGAAEVMCEEAYAAWQADTEAGIPAILLAADAATVSALNARAHNDRVADGLVGADGVTTSDGTVVGVGDHVVTRSNNRRLKIPGGYVRNGDMWHVTAIGADGSLTVTKLARTGTHTGQRAGSTRADVVLPVDYVTAHVDLGYATTTHRAQGITVDHAHVLAAPGMVRENLYVAMSRGRHDNHVYVAVDDPDPTCDYLPDPHAAPAGREVLETILATAGAELSATQTIADRQNQAESLKRLEPIRNTLLADATTQHWTAALSDTGLTPDQVAAVLASPARGPLFTALDRGTALGYPMTSVLRDLINSRPPDRGGRPGPRHRRRPAHPRRNLATHQGRGPPHDRRCGGARRHVARRRGDPGPDRRAHRRPPRRPHRARDPHRAHLDATPRTRTRRRPRPRSLAHASHRDRGPPRLHRRTHPDTGPRTISTDHPSAHTRRQRMEQNTVSPNTPDRARDSFFPDPVLHQLGGPPPPILWAAHTPDDSRHLFEDLDLWVTWLVDHYSLDRRFVPECWARHWELVEELSALHLAWEAAYATTAHADAALTRHERLALARTRVADWVARTGCRPGEHRGK